MDGAHLLTLCRSLLEYMVLDIKRPELCPYPFKLYSATDLIGTDINESHDGFVLVMRAEYEDMMGGEHYVITADKSEKLKTVAPFKFTAWVSGDKEIRVTAPLLSWHDRGNSHANFVAQNDQKEIIAALENGRNNYIKRVGINKYEIKEKIYVLSFTETEDTQVKLDGSVLVSNVYKNKAKMTKGLLKPTVLSMMEDLSKEDEAEEVVTINKKEFAIWKVSNVPRLAWHVANVAKQARRTGAFEEDVEDGSDDDFAAQLKKKATIGRRSSSNSTT
jgi:hypothetical protein